KWEGRLKAMTAAQVVELFTNTRKELAATREKLKEDETAFKQAVAAAAEMRAKLDGLKDTLLLRAEEQGQIEQQKGLAALGKQAGLDDAARDMTTTPPAETKKPEGERKPDPEKKAPPDTRSDMEKLTDTLAPLQQLLAARVRLLEEREEKTKDLLAALDDLEKKAAAHNATIVEARRLTLELTAAASDLKKRLGKGELRADKLPARVTQAL